MSDPAPWIVGSPLLAHAYGLAEAAQRSQRRATDGRRRAAARRARVERGTYADGTSNASSLSNAPSQPAPAPRGAIWRVRAVGERHARLTALFLKLDASDGAVVKADIRRRLGLEHQKVGL
jgi:hypothetical protein